MFDFQFDAFLLAHRWNPNFRYLDGPYSNDNNSLDFLSKKFKICVQIQAWNVYFLKD